MSCIDHAVSPGNVVVLIAYDHNCCDRLPPFGHRNPQGSRTPAFLDALRLNAADGSALAALGQSAVLVRILKVGALGHLRRETARRRVQRAITARFGHGVPVRRHA